MGFGLLASDVTYACWHDSGRDNCIDAILEGTDKVVVDPDIADRPDVERTVELVIKSTPTRYDLITGNPGTGKSTLVYRLARRLPGIVFATIPSAESRGSADVGSRFVPTLEAALDLRPMSMWSSILFTKDITTLQPSKHAPPFCFVYMLMYPVKRDCQLLMHISVGWRASREPLHAQSKA